MFAGQEASRHRCLSLTVHGGKRTAQHDLAKLVVEVEQGQVTAGHPGSVSELLGRLARRHRSPAFWVHEHRRSVDHDIRPTFGALRVDKLTGSHLDHTYADLLARACRQHQCDDATS